MAEPPPVRLESLGDDEQGRRFSPSAGRNQRDVVAALCEELPRAGSCLEVAAGTGEHAARAAAQLDGWSWLPTDRDEEALVSIRAWVAHVALPNLRAPRALDLERPWPFAAAAFDAIFACNLVHIAPLTTATALFRGASVSLAARGALLLYGPMFLPGEPRPPGNAAFDRQLRDRDPAFGVRELDRLEQLAGDAGLRLVRVRRMPTDNVMVRFERA
ncbi:MAG: DUF938 domain-containing protein [Planctomycetota bacterium]